MKISNPIVYCRKNPSDAQKRATEQAFQALTSSKLLGEAELASLRQALEEGADPDAMSTIPNKSLMLHCAMERNSLPAVEMLLRAGANPQNAILEDIGHPFPATFLIAFTGKPGPEILRCLLRAGMRWNKDYLNRRIFERECGAEKIDLLEKHKDICHHLQKACKQDFFGWGKASRELHAKLVSEYGLGYLEKLGYQDKPFSLNSLEGLAAELGLKDEHEIVACMAGMGKLGVLFSPMRWITHEQDALTLIDAQPAWIRGQLTAQRLRFHIKTLSLQIKTDRSDLDAATPLREWVNRMDQPAVAGKGK